MDQRVLLPGTKRLPAAVAPDLRGGSFRIDVRLREPVGTAEGVLVASGDGQAGTSLHVAGGRLVHTYHHGGKSSITTSDELEPSAMVLTLAATADAGRGTRVDLLADETPVGRGRIWRRARTRLAYPGVDVGLDRGIGVGDYTAPFAFTGSIRQVIVSTDLTSGIDEAGAMAVELATS